MADSYARAACYACGTLLGGVLPAYRWTWRTDDWRDGTRPLLCACCCIEWREWAREEKPPLSYEVRAL